MTKISMPMYSNFLQQNNKKYFWIFCVYLLGITSISCSSQALSGKVVSIKDGDTIEILLDGKPRKVRLYGIDCPEKKQDFGTKATQFTASLCFEKNVKLTVVGEDKYKRILGVVYLPDGTNLNQLLVENGLAWRYRHSTDKELLNLENTAREKEIGIWSFKDPVAPWEFRVKKRNYRNN